MKLKKKFKDNQENNDLDQENEERWLEKIKKEKEIKIKKVRKMHHQSDHY